MLAQLVRLHRCRDGPLVCGSCDSVSWSQLSRSRIWVPTASTSTGGRGRSAAVSIAETITATAPSTGTSQS